MPPKELRANQACFKLSGNLPLIPLPLVHAAFPKPCTGYLGILGYREATLQESRSQRYLPVQRGSCSL
jgi:hypothetical protein